jgi:hypothetical protein
VDTGLDLIAGRRVMPKMLPLDFVHYDMPLGARSPVAEVMNVNTANCRATASCRRGPTSAAANLNLEVHRALEYNCAESPYLTRQLSMFYHR